MKWIAIGALVLTLAACGGDDDAPDTTGPEQAVSDYTQAWGDGDTDVAWSLVSDRCQATLDERDFRASVAAAAELYGELSVTRYSETVDANRAFVDYDVSVSELSQSGQRWAREDDQWKWDAC